MVLALCFASMSACDVHISLVHPIEIGQCWFTKSKLMPNSMFWWRSLCMNLAGSMQEFTFFAAQEWTCSNFTVCGHGLQALSVAHVFLLPWCGEFASLKVRFSTFCNVEINWFMWMPFCIAGGHGLQCLNVPNWCPIQILQCQAPCQLSENLPVSGVVLGVCGCGYWFCLCLTNVLEFPTTFFWKKFFFDFYDGETIWQNFV